MGREFFVKIFIILSKFNWEAETSERVRGSSLKFRFGAANHMDQVRFSTLYELAICGGEGLKIEKKVGHFGSVTLEVGSVSCCACILDPC